MKSSKELIALLLTITLLSCNREPIYKITSVRVPDCPASYSTEATKFMDKLVTINSIDGGVKMTIGEQAPIFLKYRQRSTRTDKLNHSLGYTLEYENNADGKSAINFNLYLDINSDGTKVANITENLLGRTTACPSGPSWITTYITAK